MAAMRFRWAAALALVVCVAVVAEASIYRTTVTTTTEEEVFKGGNSGEGEKERCRQERKSLESCRRFIQTGRPELTLFPYQRDAPRRCCEQLENMREECRCEQIRQMARSLMSEAGQGEQQQMIERAEQLPQICGISQQRCSISSCKHSTPLS
ncbi:hypothetical protein AMTR_s00005p00263860 [Amborella trichopoda]|uniref:Bifunctional inhibitor/plant lipid transfer protein/seed storage helical domain-containing protein n=1 Tax=Amborella trichopoda TaxID=13333 RepID=W1PH29_AMBTC|nr:hypothetical protein AMTR_s00005p00263860 [Amborella trichopoda]